MAFDLKRIEKSARRVRKFIKKEKRRPSMKGIHALRTSARRLESALHALGLHSTRRERRLLSDLADARKRSGKVRDMDVLTGHTLSLDHDHGEQDCVVQLIEYLGAKRDTAARRLRITLRAGGPRLRRELKRAFRDIERLIEKSDQGGKRNAQAEVTANALKLLSELGAPPHLTKNNLHPYRIKVKETRDVLQLSDHAGDRQFLEKLAQVKDAIGEWHDFVELGDIAAAVLDHGQSCRVLQQLRSISEARFEKALALSGQLRGRYLRSRKPAARKSRARNHARLSPRVLAAASTLSQS